MLIKLAELYECRVADLLADCPDYRHLDCAYQASQRPLASVDLSAIWRSTYTYFSSSRGAQFEGEHYVALRQQGNRVSGRSLPHPEGSQLTLSLSLEGSVASGIWRERTSPTGYYRGASYHGTLQLVVDPRGRSMTGKWFGFSKNFENFQANSGTWQLRWVDGSLSRETQRKYHVKA